VSHYFLQAELKRCLPVLGNASMGPLISWLRGHGITTLSLVPCGALATFPLGAAILADGSTVSEALPCSVIPSARQLNSAYSTSVSRIGVYALGDTRP